MQTLQSNACSGTFPDMQPGDLDQLWKIENVRRSLTMLPAGAAGLRREDSILVLEPLAEARAERQPED